MGIPNLKSQILAWVLVFQLALPMGYSHLAASAQSPKQSNAETTREFDPALIQKSVKHAFADLFLSALEEKDAIQGEVQMPGNDASLDEDPFFLRSQRWVSLPHKNRSSVRARNFPPFKVLEEGAQIYIPGTNKAWEYQGPLRPFGMSDEYVFLSVNSKSESPLLAQHFQGLQMGEGIFLVRYEQLLANSTKNEPVPVFFFPMPKSDFEKGWQDELFFFEKPNLNLVTIANRHGEVLPILLDDIEQVVHVETINLAMATSIATENFVRELRHDPEVQSIQVQIKNLVHEAKPSTDFLERYQSLILQLSNKMGAEFLYPPAKSTAGFGMLFTLELSKAKTGTVETSFLKKWSKQLLEHVLDFLLPSKAYAQHQPYNFIEEPVQGTEGQDPSHQPESTLARLGFRAFQIIGLVMIGAIVLRYTVFKKRYAKKHAEEDATRKESIGLIKKGVREAKDVGEVAVHSVVGVSQLVSIHTGNIIEHSGDRLWPSLFAAENGLVRRFLNNTVYFVRSANQRVPLSVKTWALGTGVFGATSTALYYVHLYHTVPWLAGMVGDHSDALKVRIDDVYGINSENVDSLRKNEVLRMGINSVIGGAATIQLDFRNMYRNLYSPQVDEQMLKRGLDPKAIENISIREKMVQDRIVQMEKEMGLPPPEDYLFGADTLYTGVKKLLGNEIPESSGEVPESSVEVSDKASPTKPKESVSYLAENRPGLLVPALKRALKAAKDYAKHYPEDEKAEAAVTLLTDTLSDVSVMKAFLKAPGYALFHDAFEKGPLKERLRTATKSYLFYLNSFRKVRQSLVLLTYQGSLQGNLGGDTGIQNIPQSWLSHESANGSQLAARFFRQSFVSFMSGDTLILGPTPQQRKKYESVVTPYAESTLLKKYFNETMPKAMSRSERIETLKERHSIEYKVIVDEKIEETIRDQRSVHETKPSALPKLGRVGRWQQRRAKRIADEIFLENHGEAFDPISASSEMKRKWQNLYALELMKKVGLRPYYDEQPELEKQIRKAAELSTLQRMESDPHLLNEITDQSPADAMLSVGTLYFQNYVAEYVNHVIHSGKVNALSPAQPGRLQKFRQRAVIKKSKTLTRVCRGLESILTNEVYRPGLGGMLDRNLPFWADFKNANQRMLRYSLNNASVQYQFDKLLWRIHLSPAMWTLNKLSGILIITPWQAVNRGFRMQGFQPMGKVRTMFLYAVTASFTTIGVIFLAQVFSNDFQRLWDGLVHKIKGFKNWALGREKSSGVGEDEGKSMKSKEISPFRVNFTHN